MDKNFENISCANNNCQTGERTGSSFNGFSNANTNRAFREAVCIDTNRIYDSCADKDCLEDLRVSFSDKTQPIIDNACSIKAKSVDVVKVYMNVEPVPFNRGFYSVDMTYFFRVKLDACASPLSHPKEVTGLSVFCKKIVLFGSEANVKIFKNCEDQHKRPISENSLPEVTVQVAEPMILSSCIKECPVMPMENCCAIPSCVCECFEGSFENVIPQRVVFLTLGLFSIVQMQRRVQMMVPVYDFCLPEKECTTSSDSPCDVFKKIKFPIDEFFPPKSIDNSKNNGCGGCQ